MVGEAWALDRDGASKAGCFVCNRRGEDELTYYLRRGVHIRHVEEGSTDSWDALQVPDRLVRSRINEREGVRKQREGRAVLELDQVGIASFCTIVAALQICMGPHPHCGKHHSLLCGPTRLDLVLLVYQRRLHSSRRVW